MLFADFREENVLKIKKLCYHLLTPVSHNHARQQHVATRNKDFFSHKRKQKKVCHCVGTLRVCVFHSYSACKSALTAKEWDEYK